VDHGCGPTGTGGTRRLRLIHINAPVVGERMLAACWDVGSRHRPRFRYPLDPPSLGRGAVVRMRPRFVSNLPGPFFFADACRSLRPQGRDPYIPYVRNPNGQECPGPGLRASQECPHQRRRQLRRSAMYGRPREAKIRARGGQAAGPRRHLDHSVGADQ
jgi:hypothetical protein